MLEVPVTVFFWLVEVFTFGFVSRGKKSHPSAATVFKSLLFFIVIVAVFLLTYRFIVRS